MLAALALLAAAALASTAAPPAPPAPAPAPACPNSDETCCRYDGFSGYEHFYTLHNNAEFVVVYSGRELVLKCKDSSVSLDDACVPRFADALSVARLTLAACAAGAGSLAGALRALGVRPAALRQLELRLPRGAALPAALLAEPDQLAELQMLALLALPDGNVTVAVAVTDALMRLPALTSLHVTGIRLPTDALLPRSLRTLRLEGTGAELTREQLERLPALAALALREPGLRAPPPLSAAPALRLATVDAPLDGLPELLNVENVTFRGATSLQWRGGGCGGCGGCGALVRLRVAGGAGGPPRRWLARCGALRSLALVARALAALPDDLLDYTPHLRALDISANKLTYLDSALLARVPRLEALDASGNRLTAGGAAAALRLLPALRSLALARNPLGNLCDTAPSPAGDASRLLAVPALSPLAGLATLRRLALAATGARRVCADWPRRLPALRDLDLARNNITQLGEQELQWTAREGGEGGEGRAARLDLRGNPLRALRLRRADYLLLPEEPQQVNVVVVVDSAVACDCEAYWLVRALRERRLPAELRAACAPRAPRAGATPPAPPAAPRSLQHVPLEDMTCSVAESAGCPRGCECRWGAHRNITDARCAVVGALPDTSALPSAVRLSFPTGNFTDLPPTLPDNLVMLDVSGNNISRVTAAAAAALLARGRRVRLARNPLRCECADRPLLNTLAAHQPQVEDYDEVKCEDGQWVGEVDVAACDAAPVWLGPTLAVAGALLVAAAAAGAALALRRSALARLKALELARSLCPTFCLDSDSDDDDAEYDVFLSFAHGDRAVAARVLHALESQLRLRVCLHSRDWRAGDFIPAQIAHSVAVSRRTVVLLSERFAQSAWARAELRLAAARALRDSRPRLLVVLLTRRPPQLEPELARYVAAHTYLSYADPRFWDKLRRALAAPPRRGPPAAAPGPHGDMPAPDLEAPATPESERNSKTMEASDDVV